MGVLRLAVPVALLLWFVWKARLNALFLLGIPLLMLMGGSVFFENVKVFSKPGRFDPSTLMMVWLTFTWLVTVARRSRAPGGDEVGLFGPSRILPEELPLFGIAALVGVHMLGSFGTSGDLGNAAYLASGTFYLIAGYVLVRGIASRATRAETNEFLAAVVIANTLACGLFVLHQGLHIPIYLGQANITYTAAGVDITRATVFAPALNLLALGYVLAKRRWTFWWVVVLVVTLAAILVSLTRTLVIAALIGVVIAIIARELSRPDFTRVARRVGAILIGAVVVVVGFSRITPSYWHFLLKRLSEFTQSSQAGTQVHDWHLRVLHWGLTERVVSRGDIFFGLGFTHPGQVTVNPNYVHWTSDMTWLPIMYMFGFVGLILVALLVGGFIARSLALSLKPPEQRRELTLAYFITLVLTLIMAFQMWTFMQPSTYPMDLWIFAFIAVESLRPAEEVAAAGARATRDAGELVAS